MGLPASSLASNSAGSFPTGNFSTVQVSCRIVSGFVPDHAQEILPPGDFILAFHTLRRKTVDDT
jgi:hypothetical protein